MRKNIFLKSAVPALVLFSTQAAALPFQSVDPRSLAMGGTGVAAGTSANASFMNPALLAAAHEDEDFSFELTVGGRFVDPDGVIEELENYQDDDFEADLTDAITSFNNLLGPGSTITNTAEAQAAANLVVDTGNLLLDQIDLFAGKPLQGELFGGVIVAIPSKKIGMSLMLNGYSVGGGFVDFADVDRTLLQSILDDGSTTANAQLDPNTGLPVDVQAAQDLLALFQNQAIQDQANGTDVVSSLESGFEFRGAALVEVGVSFAREINVKGHDIAFGVTPKYVAVTTFDYRADLQDADINIDDNTTEDSSFNVDLGAAKDYGNGWKVGATIKNLIPQTFETVRGNDIKIEPQARVGVAHRTDWTVVTADLDLTENAPTGLESPTQFLGLGAELDVWNTLQLRVGYRHNLSDSDGSMPSLGLGLSPFGVHVDIAVASNGENEVAASMQFGFRF